MQDLQKEITAWAEKYVPQFNKLAKDTDSCFYTQSPLTAIDSEVELMIIGINPGCGGCYSKDISVEDFLAGNPGWKERFLENGLPHKDWGKFLSGVHTFLGYDRYKHPESIDNDSKTVWTNLTPFSTARENQLKEKQLMEIGLESTAKLIKIIKPKRILLLGVKAFSQLARVVESSDLEYENAFHNRISFSIGRIYNIPAYCVVHTSGQWPTTNHYFTTQFLDFMKKNDVVENGVPKYSISQLIEMLDKDSLIQNQIKK